MEKYRQEEINGTVDKQRVLRYSSPCIITVISDKKVSVVIVHLVCFLSTMVGAYC